PMIDLADPTIELSNFEISSGWQPFDLSDVVQENIPPIQWVIKSFLPRPSVIVIFGRPKHKKTMVVMDMCHHIAGGLTWMTSSSTASDGIEVTSARVVWVDLENGKMMLKRRMKAFAKALDVQISRGQFQAYSMPDPWLDLSKPENVITMIERIKGL